jgi:monodictyphenone polyketide synthase
MLRRYFERSSDDKFNPQSLDMCVAGLGTGLFSAAAVSLSYVLADLPFAGSEAVRVAFRLGLVVHEVSQDLQSFTGAQACDSWAYVVSGVSHEEVQNELDSIQEVEVRRMFLPDED